MWPRILTLLLLAGASAAQSIAPAAPNAPAPSPLSADEIMARVAANQDRAENLRKEYVYKQHVRVAIRQTNGRLRRDETADYDVFPTPEGSDRRLQSLAGQYLHKGKLLEFKGEPRPDEDSFDAELVQDFRDDASDEGSQRGPRNKDGMGRHLFPLTKERQGEYVFHLIDSQALDGRDVYHIGFGPKDKSDYDWAGEAFIDKADFQPVMVFTKLSRKLPFFVRNVMGVNVPGAGYTVHYKQQEDGVWFPVSFGTEFGLDLFHFVKRNIFVSLENREFKHTHVDTKIQIPESHP